MHLDVSSVDAQGLAAELRRRLRGEVRFDDGSRALYATDASNYRQVPIGVVIPRDEDDVIATVETARRFGAPILPRGGGTSLAGQCCNVAVVMDFSKYMHRLVELAPQGRRARVQPGLVLDGLRDAAEHFHLTFGPDPATHNRNTLGGMMGNNSCGVHSVMAGKTDDNVEELDVLTYDGLRLRVGATSDEDYRRIVQEGGRRAQIYQRLRALRDRYADLIRARYPRIPRCVSGYNLPALLPENGFHVARALVGSEGTCVTFLEGTVRLVPSPAVRSLLVLGYPDVYSAGDHIMELMAHQPIGLEGLDDLLLHGMEKGRHPQGLALLPPGGGWLLVEFGADTKAQADARARGLMEALRRRENPPAMKLCDDPEQARTLWKLREAGVAATARVPGERDAWPGWEDVGVPPERLGDYLRDFRTLLDRYGYACALYGHFGQGCVHARIDFDLLTRQGIRQWRAFLDDAADLVLRYGGSLSGEHGDGQSRAELLPKMFGEELVQAFRELKSIWDPDGKMNPGKIVDPYRIDENLRLGSEYRPAEPATHFQFPDDGGSFSRAVLRCVGVGECRRERGQTMCPSYRVTREERHSTRGRARMLFEMLQGEVIREGWRDGQVQEALDLCLSCKGCKDDCPMQVDMATYKAEFLSHYYAGRLRPVAAYTLGLIHRWARLAALAPRIANLCTQTPVLSGLVKRLAGIAPQRELPAFAPRTFKQRFFSEKAAHGPRNRPRVVLWPDTFTNHFHPQTAMAGVEVLEAAGFQVTVPRPWLCCGRPLYEYGMLGQAKRLLRRTLTALQREIRDGVPVVGLEPSCVTTFRDELVNLFPHDQDARRLCRQTFLLSEFLEAHARDFPPCRHGAVLERKALLHQHCYHKAVLRADAEDALLRRLGLDLQVLDSGCCGAAGGFGFEKEHYDIARAVGEEVLLPAVRNAAPDTLIIADGFICREQIRQHTGREALHPAEVMRLALHAGAHAAPPGDPACDQPRPRAAHGA